MSRPRISAWLRERVSEQADRRCGYCQTTEAIIGAPMEIDHIIPYARGGSTTEDNLWLACSPCNERKGTRIGAIDPTSGEIVRLFDPRRQAWSEHFAWSPAGDIVIGLTATGRVTVRALHLNRATLVVARRAWVAAGWHPPSTINLIGGP